MQIPEGTGARPWLVLGELKRRAWDPSVLGVSERTLRRWRKALADDPGDPEAREFAVPDELVGQPGWTIRRLAAAAVLLTVGLVRDRRWHSTDQALAALAGVGVDLLRLVRIDLERLGYLTTRTDFRRIGHRKIIRRVWATTDRKRFVRGMRRQQPQRPARLARRRPARRTGGQNPAPPSQRELRSLWYGSAGGHWRPPPTVRDLLTRGPLWRRDGSRRADGSLPATRALLGDRELLLDWLDPRRRTPFASLQGLFDVAHYLDTAPHRRARVAALLRSRFGADAPRLVAHVIADVAADPNVRSVGAVLATRLGKLVGRDPRDALSYGAPATLGEAIRPFESDTAAQSPEQIRARRIAELFVQGHDRAEIARRLRIDETEVRIEPWALKRTRCPA